MSATNLMGIGDRRCPEPLPMPTGSGQSPVTLVDGTIDWVDLSAGIPGNLQEASEVPIDPIAALGAADDVQEALEALAIRPYRLMVGMGGDSADVVIGNTVTFRAPDAFTVTNVRASLKVASTFGNVEIDVKKNGVSIFSTALTIDANEKTSQTAAVPAVLSTTSIAEDDEIIVQVIDDGISAKGAVVTIKGTYS